VGKAIDEIPFLAQSILRLCAITVALIMEVIRQATKELSRFHCRREWLCCI